MYQGKAKAVLYKYDENCGENVSAERKLFFCK
jgi:hypothetical protein